MSEIKLPIFNNDKINNKPYYANLIYRQQTKDYTAIFVNQEITSHYFGGFFYEGCLYPENNFKIKDQTIELGYVKYSFQPLVSLQTLVFRLPPVATYVPPSSSSSSGKIYQAPS